MFAINRVRFDARSRIFADIKFRRYRECRKPRKARTAESSCASLRQFFAPRAFEACLISCARRVCEWDETRGRKE